MSISIINNIIVPYPTNIKISQVSVQPAVYKAEWIYNGAPCNVELILDHLMVLLVYYILLGFIINISLVYVIQTF